MVVVQGDGDRSRIVFTIILRWHQLERLMSMSRRDSAFSHVSSTDFSYDRSSRAAMLLFEFSFPEPHARHARAPVDIGHGTGL